MVLPGPRFGTTPHPPLAHLHGFRIRHHVTRISTAGLCDHARLCEKRQVTARRLHAQGGIWGPCHRQHHQVLCGKQDDPSHSTAYCRIDRDLLAVLLVLHSRKPLEGVNL